ncbi:MAG: CvpA family protein [Candidatus Cloacimonetes bacterium]|nr:CvpA family protein [Candidatus Cloacimonadota bacterium]
MNVLDIILAVVLIVLLFNGLRKGFVNSIVSLLSLVVIILIIAKLGHVVKNELIFRLECSDLVAAILSYILISIVIYLIARITVKVLQMILELLHLKWLDRLLGAVFGVFNGVLVIAIMILLLNLLPYEKQITEFTSSSVIASNIRSATDIIEAKYPELKKRAKTIGEEIHKKTEGLDQKIREKMK